MVVSYANGLEPEAEEELADHVIELADELEGRSTASGQITEVLVGGEPIVLQEFETQAEEDLVRGEMVALPIALVAMIVIFGGVRAAGMPLAVAAAAFLTAGIALLGATFVLDTVSVFALNVVSMLGIGLGIDYGLLLVSRFREERGQGATVAQAVEITVATAGVTVVFSALTVAVAMSGMFVFDDPTMTSFGVGGLSAVIFSMIAALTLLPALLGVLGAKIRPAKVQPAGTGAFFRLSRVVQRFALPILIVVGTGLALLATALPRRQPGERRRPQPAPVLGGQGRRPDPQRPVPQSGGRADRGHRRDRGRHPRGRLAGSPSSEGAMASPAFSPAMASRPASPWSM